MKRVFYFDGPCGPIGIAEDGRAVTNVFLREEKAPVEAEVQATPLLKRAGRQLGEYMAGRRRAFDVPLKPDGTEFQRRVWQALLTIPYGETRSYKEIAVQIGNPRACRAVGMANNRNPIAILIPCHRVIGANGNLVGYGGGLELKEWLLALERAQR